MAVLTEKRKIKEKQYAEIKRKYHKMMSEAGSQKYGCYERLSKEYGYSATSIGRIVGNIKRK